MHSLNLGILAHVDAGKTSLTERLLHAAGVIDQIGSVEKGSTQTDTLALERQRGITIKSAVVSFVANDVTVNLIDTPGHPDFIAEVERVLNVLDGVVLVISAVEGVQAQTRVLMRALQRLRIPTLMFVNKIDRRGADVEHVLRAITDRLTPDIIPMESVHDLGTPGAGCALHGEADVGFVSSIAAVLARHHGTERTGFLADGASGSFDHLRQDLAVQTKSVLVHPVFFGSAITGAGVDALIAGITELLPAAQGDPDGPVSGIVFKVERGPDREKIAYVRMFSGTIRTRDRLQLRGGSSKVTSISVIDRGPAGPASSVEAGRIGKLWGLGTVQIGDAIGSSPIASGDRQFAPPTLETVVVPGHRVNKGALHTALAQLAEQDPLINLRQDDVRQELYLSLYGEVQKEVIGQTLAAEFAIDVEFRQTTPICTERPIGIGSAVEFLGEPSNPFLATVGLRIEPGPPDSGIVVRFDVKLESIPRYVYKSVGEFERAVSATVRDTLREGIRGWSVTDCEVVLADCGYTSPGTTSGDFGKLTPLVLMTALRRAGTVVCEPIHSFRLEIPAGAIMRVSATLSRLGAVIGNTEVGERVTIVSGEIAASHVYELQQRLPGLSMGEGVLESAFASYRPVRGVVPRRTRTDNNPLNRKEYLRRVTGGSTAGGKGSAR
jgi:ribosomal protection tetracycline resistance protein